MGWLHARTLQHGPEVHAPHEARPPTLTLRSVQALRGIAALIVVVVHISGPGSFEERLFGSSWTRWASLPASIGVDLFFVISGFIIIVTTWRSFDEPGATGRFLWRRATRIYPVYWVVTSLVILVLVVSPGAVGFDAGPEAPLLNAYLLVPSEHRFPLLVAWTLVYEVYFYAVFAAGLLLRRRLFPVVLGAWSAATLGLHFLVGQTDRPVLAQLASPLNLEFSLGVLIGYAVIHRKLLAPRVLFVAGVVAWLGVLGLLATSGWTDFPSSMFRLLVPGVASALLLYGSVGKELVRGLRVPRLLERLGDCSYSMYLVHVPALKLLSTVLLWMVPAGPVWHALTLIVLPVYVALVAYAFHRGVERPLLALFQRRLPRRRRPELVASTTEPAPLDV